MFGGARAEYFRPSLRYSLASTHAGPISRYRRSVKKLGLRPSNSLLCPTNCAIHATTNTAMAAYSRFHTPKVSYTQRVNQAMADRKSTRLNSVTNAHLVCRLLLEKKPKNKT